jgi:hypothetical protein
MRGAQAGSVWPPAPLAVLAAIALAFAVFAGGLTSAGVSGTRAVAAPAPAVHVVVMVMENKEARQVVGNASAPYLNRLARRYGLATASYAVTHPSLPNYLTLTSGSTDGVTSDCTGCSTGAANIVDQLSRAGRSWTAYLEDYPGGCFSGPGAGRYAKKHNPFIYYADIARSRARCAHLVGFGALTADLRARRLPNFAWITPNMCDDTHDCAVAAGDRFLARIVPQVLPALGPRGILILTWDEATTNAGCCGRARGGHIATLMIGRGVRPGARLRTPVDHYGVLATVEQLLGLPSLGNAADPRSGSLAPLLRP